MIKVNFVADSSNVSLPNRRCRIHLWQPRTNFLFHPVQAFICIFWKIVCIVLNFFSFFWTFFHRPISPSIEINIIWPPKIIKVFNYIEIPLLNTFTWITSGFYITLSHLYILNNFFLKKYKSITFYNFNRSIFFYYSSFSI